MATCSLQRCGSPERLVIVSSPKPIVVVGAGTAGCTVVSYLASHTDLPIVVLDPGQFSEHDDEARFFDVLETGLFSTTPDGYVQGKAIGGGSAVNGLLLTGEEPEHLRGLTRLATADDIGVVGKALLEHGGRFSRLWWNGGRWNPGRAVRHLVEEGRVQVMPCNVSEVLHQDGHVVGVVCSDGPISAAAVVLCAGALVTPSILLNSGLGEINPAIGVGLQNHPTLTATFTHATSEARFDAAVVREWETQSGGYMLNVAYERSDAFHNEWGMLSVSLMNPVSRGFVSSDDKDVPVVHFHLLKETFDIEQMILGVLDLIQLLRVGNFSSHSESIVIEGASLDQLVSMGENELREWVIAHVQGVSHATSSCAGAVNALGQVEGLENCWIADASVLPSVPSGTPAAPVTMEARRIARNIGESLS